MALSSLSPLNLPLKRKMNRLKKNKRIRVRPPKWRERLKKIDALGGK